MDTVDRVMRHLKTEQIERLKQRMVQTLLRKKVFHNQRYRNRWFTVAIDGTGVMSFDEQHCEQCLHKTSKKGRTTWMHHVLEARLVTANGFSISLMSEWIENPADKAYDKQDCERKAFTRLASRLKQAFPRLSKHSIKSVNIYNIQCFETYLSIKKWYIVLIQLSSFSHLLNNESLINI